MEILEKLVKRILYWFGIYIYSVFFLIGLELYLSSFSIEEKPIIWKIIYFEDCCAYGSCFFLAFPLAIIISLILNILKRRN